MHRFADNVVKAIWKLTLSAPPLSNFLDNGYISPECGKLDFRLPGQFPTNTAAAHNILGGFISSNSGELCNGNVLQVALHDPNFSVFADLMQAAGLADIFLCAGPYTAMIPTNSAFQKLDSSVLMRLLQPQNRKELQELLLYHLLPGRRPANAFQPGHLQTIQGENVQVTREPLKINNAQVLRMNIEACNGIIQELDEVLLGMYHNSIQFLVELSSVDSTFFLFLRTQMTKNLRFALCTILAPLREEMVEPSVIPTSWKWLATLV